MFPELFKVGSFPVNTYGVLLAIGMMLALVSASKLAARDGISKDRIYDLGLWTLIGGLAGSKVLMLFTEENVNIFSLDFLRSGGVYYGGLIGGFLTVALLIRFYNLPFWKVADAFAPGVAIGQAIGREGCFAAGCCWGRPTSSIFGVHFSEKAHEFTGVPIGTPDNPIFLHPTQLYESLAMFVVFGFLLWLHKRKKFDGQVLVAYGIIYGIIRFSIEFLRDDPRGNLFGLTDATGLSTSQMISLFVVACSVTFMAVRLTKLGNKSA